MCAGAAHTLLGRCRFVHVAAARLLGLLLLFGRLVEVAALRAGLALLLCEAILVRHSLARGARLALGAPLVAPRGQGGRRRGGGRRRRGRQRRQRRGRGAVGVDVVEKVGVLLALCKLRAEKAARRCLAGGRYIEEAQLASRGLVLVDSGTRISCIPKDAAAGEHRVAAPDVEAAALPEE